MKRQTQGQPQKTTWTRRRFVMAGGALGTMLLLAACDLPEDAPPDLLPTVTPTPVVNAEVSAQPVQSAPPTGAAVVTIDEQARAFAQLSIELVNQARTNAGHLPLVENPTLTQVAVGYSQRMAREGFYGHDDPQGKQASDRIAAAGYLAQMSAENIARGQPDAPTVAEGWLNSPGHYANIMNPELREIGAGYAYTDADNYRHYWTHVFATPDASVGRDRSLYPAQVIEQANLVRQQAGIPPVRHDDTLASIAETYLPALVAVAGDEAEANRILNEAGDAVLQTFTMVAALSSAGAATPEEVVAQWAETQITGENAEIGSTSLLDGALTAAGVAYYFVEQDDYRHYWLLLMGS